ncbi:MAG: ATP-binding protein, partial [Acidobacteriota bacterium]
SVPFCRADGLRITQVLRNLVSNADKYSERDQPVEIRIETGDLMVRLSVRDFGNGMTQDQQANLFKSFYRAAPADIPGTGLGLMISQKIIEKHGGSMEVWSTPGKGTKVTFSLPLGLEGAPRVPSTRANG